MRSVVRAWLAAAAVLVVALPLHAQAPKLVPPRAIEEVAPIVPEKATPPPHGTEVVLVVTIDAQGNITDVAVDESAGQDFDEAAIHAMRQWKFAPATRDGHPIPSRIRVPFHFAPHGTTTEPGAAEKPAPAAPSTAPPVVVPAEKTEREEPIEVPTATRTEEVSILGRRPAPQRGSSDYTFRLGALQAVPRKDAAEMLRLAPGVLLTNEGGEGHAEQIFLRGFDARLGQDIEFSAGGVPINEVGNVEGNGYADTHFVLPELVESLRILEGPFDPRQGNFAVAGSADYELGLTRRGVTGQYTLGSWGTERMVLLWGPEGASTHTFGGAEIYKTDGYGQNRDARRATAMGQYEGRLGDLGSYRILGTAYATNYHSAGVLRDDDYRAGRVGFYDTYDPRQGGDASRYSISADLESRSGEAIYREQVFLVMRGYRSREDFTGYLLDVQQPTQNPHGQRGDLLDQAGNETTIGSRGSTSVRGRAFGQTHELEVGYFARGDFVDGTRTRVDANNVPYRLESDLSSKVGDLGLYGDAGIHATKWLTFRGGGRADFFSYDVLDKCAVHEVRLPSKQDPQTDQSCLSQQQLGQYREPTQRASTASTAVMPRASVLVGPFEGFTLSAGYGVGTRSIDPDYVAQDAKTPFVRVTAVEGGVSYAKSIDEVEIQARSTFFQTGVERDLFFSETAGRTLLGGGTTRTGWAGVVRATGTFFDEAANVTLVKATIDETHLLVPYVPDVVVRSDTAFFGMLPLKLSGEPLRGTAAAGVTYVGRRPLPYGERSDTIFTVDVHGSVAWSAFELGIAVTNLFDTRYRLGEFDYASDFHSAQAPTLVPVRHFTAGVPRSTFATLSVTLGGT